MIADKAATPCPELSEANNMEFDLASTVESYKRRTNSYFRNPLVSPKEMLVNVPEKEKMAATRTPFY